MELVAHGLTVEDAPRILSTYMFCSPGLDGEFRCLPKAGGYYDQDYIDMIGFGIIERKLGDVRRRQAEQKKADQGGSKT